MDKVPDEPLAAAPMPVQSPSLVRAWLTIGQRPTRPVILAAARVATARWVVISLLLALALDYSSNIASVLIRAAPAGHISEGWWVASLINGLLVFPVSYLLGVLATAWLVGYFSRGRTAPVTSRFWRALRPYALAQVPGEIVSLLLALALAAIGPPTQTTDNIFLSTGPLLHLVLTLGGCGVALAAAIYYVALLVNALYVGSGLNRFVCFLLAAVATLVAEVAVGGIAALVGAPFGLHMWPFPWP